MPKYVLGHDLKGEGTRLTLMSQLLDPMHLRGKTPPTVVILRRSSNFAGATISRIYAYRDRAQYFYFNAVAFTGGA